MAVDSIMARPTNRVRVMVAEASGCWASELRAEATALPSASAGPIVPNPVVRPATTIDATATIVMVSIECPFRVLARASGCCFGLRLGFADAGGGRDVDRRQDAENVGLHHSREEAEGRHEDREDEGRDREQDPDDHCAAHHVAEQPDGKRQRARHLTDDVERKHDERRLRIGLEICLLYTSPSPRDRT